MIRKRLQIINKLGLHARASAKLVQKAASFSSHIELSKNGKTVNGKSIMGVMMLAAAKDSWIELILSGDDEHEALQSLETLINERFGEAQ